jgi:hypothetical protein
MANTTIKRKYIMATRKPKEATTKKPAVASKTTAKTKKTAAPSVKKPAAKTAPKLKVSASAKAAATKAGEPYITVVGVEIDPDNVQNGAFELDWNDIFVARLLKAGYKGKDDAQIVDQWFQDICRNVIMENFEQWNANQTGENRVVVKRDLGNGKTEVS